MPIFNELLVLILILGGFIILGASPIIMQVRSKNKPQRWGYKYTGTTNANMKTATISLEDMTVSSSKDLLQPLETSTPTNYSEVELTDYTELVKMAKIEPAPTLEPATMKTSLLEDDALSQIMLLCNDDEITPSLVEDDTISDELFNEICELCAGINTASLVTTEIPKLKVDKMSVIFGTFDKEGQTLSWDNETITLSSQVKIYQEDKGLLLLKGMKLINGEFRVISYDAPDNIEAGYNIDSFIIDDKETLIS